MDNLQIDEIINGIDKTGVKLHVYNYSEKKLESLDKNILKMVKINDSNICKLAGVLKNFNFALSSWDNTSLPTAPSRLDRKTALCYFIILNSINFCFWKYEKKEKWCYILDEKEWDGALGLFAFITSSFNSKQSLEITLKYFSELNKETFEKDHKCTGFLPLLDERIEILNRTANVLEKMHNDSFKELFNAADKSTSEFIKKILIDFQDYYDPFLKRAQLLVGMLQGFFNRYHKPLFKDISDLTLFADYKVPQTLERLQVMTYSDELVNMLENNTLIPENSDIDIILRASTIISGEKILTALKKEGYMCGAAELDYALWSLSQSGNGSAVKLGPKKSYQKVLTKYY